MTISATVRRIMVMACVVNFCASVCRCEVIKLKDGRVAKGEITSVTYDYIYFVKTSTKEFMKVNKIKVESIDKIPLAKWKYKGNKTTPLPSAKSAKKTGKQTDGFKHGSVNCTWCALPNPSDGKYCTKCGEVLPK